MDGNRADKPLGKPAQLICGHHHKVSSSEIAAIAAQRRADERAKIVNRYRTRLENEDGQRPPAAPAGASEAERNLIDAAHELHEQLQPLREDTPNYSPEDWAPGWKNYEKAIGRMIREGRTDHPMVRRYEEALRTFADKRTLDKHKNIRGRQSIEGHSMLGHVDFWIVHHGADSRRRGRSVREIRQKLLTRLPDRPLPRGCRLTEVQKCRRLERLAVALLNQKLAQDRRAVSEEHRLAAEMAAIGWLWRSEIRRRLGTDENLRKHFVALGIEPDDSSN